MIDVLGDRLKKLERNACLDPFPVHQPVYARLDGRGFSKFTKDMDRPFDPRMTRAMQRTAEVLVEKTHARAAYTQSDEISLVWQVADENSELLFGGKPSKLTSVLAGLATSAFCNALLNDENGLSSWLDRLPHFDARVLSCSDRETAADFFRWRGQDARRNAIQMIAQSKFSHRQLHKKSIADQIEMLEGLCVNIDSYPEESLNGTLITRQKCLRTLTQDERLAIPAAHRPEPDHKIMRGTTLWRTDLPPQRDEHLEDTIFRDPEKG